MKYHALFVIFEKRQNLKVWSAAVVVGALRINKCMLLKNHSQGMTKSLCGLFALKFQCG